MPGANYFRVVVARFRCPATIIAAWFCAYDAARGHAGRWRVARSHLPSKYVVRAAAGETPPKLTPSASSATRLRHGFAFVEDDPLAQFYVSIDPKLIYAKVE